MFRALLNRIVARRDSRKQNREAESGITGWITVRGTEWRRRARVDISFPRPQNSLVEAETRNRKPADPYQHVPVATLARGMAPKDGAPAQLSIISRSCSLLFQWAPITDVRGLSDAPDNARLPSSTCSFSRRSTLVKIVGWKRRGTTRHRRAVRHLSIPNPHHPASIRPSLPPAAPGLVTRFGDAIKAQGPTARRAERIHRGRPERVLGRAWAQAVGRAHRSYGGAPCLRGPSGRRRHGVGSTCCGPV